jgi:hypothetical protein
VRRVPVTASTMVAVCPHPNSSPVGARRGDRGMRDARVARAQRKHLLPINEIHHPTGIPPGPPRGRVGGQLPAHAPVLGQDPPQSSRQIGGPKMGPLRSLPHPPAANPLGSRSGWGGDPAVFIPLPSNGSCRHAGLRMGGSDGGRFRHRVMTRQAQNPSISLPFRPAA